MNSAASSWKNGALAALVAAGALAMAAAGCSDRGPTNLYSQSLFGQKQGSATLQVWHEQEYTLDTSTAGVGPDQYVVWLKNTGSGSTVGPITATLSIQQSGCTGMTLSNTTAVFGSPNQAINPGDSVLGYATSNGAVINSQYQYTWQTNTIPTACSLSASTITFNVTATDTRGGSWTSTFSGTNN